MGEYLKQLDKKYIHPKYVVDFLLIYTDEERTEHKIILEYDGFEHHFENHDSINEFNFDQYYTAEHIYREKVLESYGYKFIRLNRFNTSKNPVVYLDKVFLELVKKKTRITH